MKTNAVRQDVIAFCKAEGQWRRELRLAHAKWQHGNAITPDAREFWRQVADINSLGGTLRVPLEGLT
jgi:hypothetical protein